MRSSAAFASTPPAQPDLRVHPAARAGRGPPPQQAGELDRRLFARRQAVRAQFELVDRDAPAGGVVAERDPAVAEPQFAQRHLHRRSRRAGTRRRRGLGRGRRQAVPVGAAAGLAVQFEFDAVQAQRADLQPPGQQRQRLQVHLGAVDPQHRPRREAGRVVERHAAGGEADQRRREVQPQAAVDGERPAGAALDQLHQLVAVVVRVERQRQVADRQQPQQQQRDRGQRQPAQQPQRRERRVHADARSQSPERPPDLRSRPTSPMRMPRSTALHMS